MSASIWSPSQLRSWFLDLELAWLRSWLEVVDSGGFARAADRSHLSQLRISAHVASLELALEDEGLLRADAPTPR
jgi:DNA-binding transcriptional LysR family regulator